MLKKVAFTMYPVTDVERSRRFYEGLLGLTPGLAGSQGGMHWIEYHLPEGGCLAITNATPNTPSASAGGTIAFEVDDLDALIARLEAEGVGFLGDIVRGPRCRMRTCLDPEGNAVVLHQLDRTSRASWSTTRTRASRSSIAASTRGLRSGKGTVVASWAAALRTVHSGSRKSSVITPRVTSGGAFPAAAQQSVRTSGSGWAAISSRALAGAGK